jgi:hypothetical protein
VWGDIHEVHLSDATRRICWGPGGVTESLRPSRQVFHDLLDFESQSHHNRRDPYRMLALHTVGRDSVRDECARAGAFLKYACRGGVAGVVVQSNHDMHLERWLREVDWRQDVINAEFQAEAHMAYVRAIMERRRFNALEWAIAHTHPVDNVTWLGPDDSYIVCDHDGDGVELCFHGDRGANGAKGTLRNMSRLARKVVIGHGHGAGILNGAWQVGVMVLNMDYIAGSPSNWSTSFCVIHDNGKRQMLTMYAGKWRA